jgi:hypothetical protein
MTAAADIKVRHNQGMPSFHPAPGGDSGGSWKEAKKKSVCALTDEM